MVEKEIFLTFSSSSSSSMGSSFGRSSTTCQTLGAPILVLGTFGAHGSWLSAAEAESFLHTFLAFFSCEFSYFDDVYVHGVGVTGLGGGGEGVVRLVSGFRVLFRDLLSVFPLGLEVNGLFVPVVDGGRDGVHGHDSAHEGGGDSGREVPDEDILVGDTCEC